MKQTTFDRWEVIAAADGWELPRKFQVNGQHSDAAKVAEEFKKNTQHPHRNVNIEPLAAYPIDKDGKKIDGAPAWKLEASATVVD